MGVQKFIGSKRMVSGKDYEAIEGSSLTCRGCAFLGEHKECELITVHKENQMCQANSVIYKLIK